MTLPRPEAIVLIRLFKNKGQACINGTLQPTEYMTIFGDKNTVPKVIAMMEEGLAKANEDGLLTLTSDGFRFAVNLL